MRKATTVIFLLIFVFACSAIAEPLSKETFFGKCIDEKIIKCEKKSALLNSTWEKTRAAGDRAYRELSFLQDNRETLVRQMLALDLPMKGHNVDHFLIKAFVEDVRLAKE